MARINLVPLIGDVDTSDPRRRVGSSKQHQIAKALFDGVELADGGILHVGTRKNAGKGISTVPGCVYTATNDKLPKILDIDPQRDLPIGFIPTVTRAALNAGRLLTAEDALQDSDDFETTKQGSLFRIRMSHLSRAVLAESGVVELDDKDYDPQAERLLILGLLTKSIPCSPSEDGQVFEALFTHCNAIQQRLAEFVPA